MAGDVAGLNRIKKICMRGIIILYNKNIFLYNSNITNGLVVGNTACTPAQCLLLCRRWTNGPLHGFYRPATRGAGTQRDDLTAKLGRLFHSTAPGRTKTRMAIPFHLTLKPSYNNPNNTLPTSWQLAHNVINDRQLV
jgi:hypothetical protein